MALQQTPRAMAMARAMRGALLLTAWAWACAAAMPLAPGAASNCAALAGSCVCIGDDVAQCVDTNAHDLSFLRGLRNRSRFSEVIVYHNSIPSLRNATFQDLQLTNLKTIRLAYNGIVTVEPRAFQGLRKLKKLVLVRNNIRALHPTTFHNATKLSLVDLSNNQISEINAVRHVPNLEDCRLANNSITALRQRAFCSTHSCRLRSINLANNDIQHVDSWAFHGLQNLESLNLSENKVSSLHYLTFVNLTNLKELDLRRNWLSAVDFVCEIESLKYLFLSENRITHVTNDTFVCGHQSSLVHIDLSGNQIVMMEPAAFHGLYSVWDLLLGRNHISDIHPATFLNCTDLRSLDLKYNRISDLHFIRDIIMLWNLDLSHNEIESVPSGTFSHHNLTQLLDSGVNTTSNVTTITFVLSRTITSINLAHNRLTYMDRGALDGLYKLHHLDLSWNNISSMPANIFQRHTQMTRLDIQGNRLSNLEVALSAPVLLTCDVSNNGISTLPVRFTHTSRVNHLQLSGNNISHLHPQVFSNFSQLNLLNLTDNNLNTTRFVNSASELEYVYLSKNNLSNLQQHAFNTPFTSTLKSIDVSYNRISSIHEGAFEGMDTLLNLNMSHNKIASLSQGVFRHTTRLKELRLSHNALTRVDFVGALHSVKYLFLANNSVASVGGWLATARALAAVDLSGNALTALPDDAFRDLAHLQAVDASANALAHVAAGAFRNASRLRVLRLARNRLSAVDFMGGAAALVELDLSHNQVSALPEPLLAGVGRSRLARLDLSHNRLSALGPGALRNLGALHALELGGNALAQLHPAALAQCSALLQLGLGANRLARLSDVPHAPRLKHLYVFANRLPRLANDSFAASRLSQVVHLNVSGSGVAELEGGVFRSLRMLRYLDLSRNLLRALPDGVFAANTLLSALDLRSNRLLSLGAQLRPSVCLEFVDASDNALTTVVDGTFRDQIRYLDLSRNSIASVAAGTFDVMRKLEVLDLSMNNLSSFAHINLLRDDSVVLLAGNPASGNVHPPRVLAAQHQKRFFNLFDISTNELDKFAKLYMWILQVNMSTT